MYMNKAYETGFAGRVLLTCSDRNNAEVTAEDGCTFGVVGNGGTLKADVDATIETHAAVYGYSYE